MACIIIKKEEVIQEVSVQEEAEINDRHWILEDEAAGAIKRNVMYYAWDVRKVLAQANGEPCIPVFLEVKKGEITSTVLALKKPISNNEEDVDPENTVIYYPFGASGWPPRYEDTKEFYGPDYVLDYINGEEVTVENPNPPIPSI